MRVGAATWGVAAAGSIGVGEEPDGIDVLGASAAGDHLGEIGREVRLRHRPVHDVAAGAARVEDWSNAHGCLGPVQMLLAPPRGTRRAIWLICPHDIMRIAPPRRR